MKPFLKGFLSVVGALGQPSTTTAVEPPTVPTNNDSFLTKLGQPSPRSSVRSGQSEVRFVQSYFVVDEGAGVAKITVERSCGERELPVAFVSYESHETNYSGSAAKNIDYHHVFSTLRWEVFECGPKTFSIPIVDDSESEFSETLRLTLSNAQGMTLSSYLNNSQLLIISDNDVSEKQTTLSFDNTSYTVQEGGETVVSIRRKECEPHAPAISATLAIEPNTADTTDYSISPTFPLDENGNYILNWGEVRYLSDCNKSFYVYSKNDALIEGTEDFEMILSNPSEGAIIGQGNAVLNIIDNDGSTIGFSQYNYQPDENKQGVMLTVERKNCIEGYIPKITLENLSSKFSSVYSGHHPTTSTPDQLIWQKNECGSKNIEVKSDNYAPNYSYTIFAPSAPSFFANFEVEINSCDNTHFYLHPSYVIESSEIATVDVERYGCDNNTNVAEVLVRYRTFQTDDYYYDSASVTSSYSGTQDYTDTSGFLTWQENECGTKSFTVSIIDNSKPEYTEKIGLDLYCNSSYAYYFDQSDYVQRDYLFIIDDDVAAENTSPIYQKSLKITLYENTFHTLELGRYFKAPLTSISSDPNIVTVDNVGNVKAINTGQATVTTTDVMGNSVKRITTVLPEEFSTLTFNSPDKVKVGDALEVEVKVTTSYKNPDPEQLLDLWVFIESPNLDRRLYVTSSDYLSSLFSYDPQPVRINLEKMNNTYPVFRFGVTSAMAGKYTLYAMLAKQGENPLVNTQAQMSNLARATVTLLKE